jgi:YidC/Oxa1 family membrane protein insertase
MEEQKLLVRRTAIGEEMEIGAPAPADGRSRYTLFIGPKDIDLLRAMGRGLDRAIDLGFFGFISFPFLYVLRLFHRLTGSYGVDIILLTLLVKLLMAPLTHRSFVSMKRMKRLQPQIELLKEKFKKDADRLNKEMTALYRSHHVSPLGGCLPMVLQAPVFMGLYQALRSPIEFRHAPFLWIHDLSRPDWQALPITVAGWSFGIPVLTLLMGASMLTQQWMAPAVEDLDRRRLAMATPLIFTVMFVNFPAGLTVYWLANNLLTIAQQYLINRLDDP